MNKKELISLLADSAHLTKTQAKEVVDITFGAIIDSLERDEDVSLLGFGSFKPKLRPARQGVNPKTGEKILIQSKKIVQFTPSQAMKDAIV